MSEDSRDRAIKPGEQTLPLAISWRWLPVALGVLIALAFSAAVDWLPPTSAVDISQQRVNSALPPLENENAVRQTFISRQDGLSEIELILVRHGEAEDGGQLKFQLSDSEGETVAQRLIDTREVVHNQTLLLEFPPQADSKGQSYTLTISGTPGNQVSVWGYDLDVYSGGALELNGIDSEAKDLRFVTRYQLQPVPAAARAIEMAWSNLALIVVSILVLLLPGCLVLAAGCQWLGKLDPVVWLGAATAIGASTWPIIWFWLTLVGGRWRSWSLWMIFVIGWLLFIFILVYRCRKALARDETTDVDKQTATPNARLAANSESKISASSRSGFDIGRSLKRPEVVAAVLLLSIVLVGFAVRLLAVRDQQFPLWVDSSRHGLITTLMVDSGQFLEDYRPLLPVDNTLYHYGFHAIAASTALMTGEPVPNLLLIMGQLINVLVALTIYSATYLMTRSRVAGLLAAFLVTLPFLFPGYYVTWGRYTQLTGMLILPIAAAFSWKLVRGSRNWRNLWWIVGILAAGLFFIHLRVFLFYVVFALLVSILSLGRHIRHLLLASALALVLIAPRIYELNSTFPVAQTFSSTPGYNDFPVGYLRAGWELGFLVLGTACLLVILAALVRRRRWAAVPLAMVLWVGVVLLLVAGRRIGLPETWLVNINSAYISLFFPLSVVIAVVTVRIWRWLIRAHWSTEVGARLAAGTILTIVTLFGIAHQVAILNPATILITSADAKGLAWLAENRADSSVVAVNSWQWLADIWAASDGGAWIVPETALTSTTPPVDYTYDGELRSKVNDYNQAAAEIEDWSDPAAAAWLRDNQVDLVFVGTRGGSMDPSELTRNPGLTNIYQSDGVFVFVVD